MPKPKILAWLLAGSVLAAFVPSVSAQPGSASETVEQTIERQARAYRLFIEAQELAASSRNEQAREALEQVLEIDPGAARVRAMLARLCLREGDIVCAEAQAIRATDTAEPDAEGHKVRAELAFGRYRSTRQQEHIDSAIRHWRKVVDIEPQDLNVWTLLIRVLSREGRFEEAEQVAREAASTPGVDPAAPWVGFARALLATGQSERAVALLENLDLTGRAAVPLLQMLADLKGSQEDLAGQVEALRRLRELRPQDPHLAYRYGRGLMEQGEVFAAIGPLQDALQARPNDPLVRRDLASALVSLGRGEEALPLLTELPDVYASEQILFVWSRAAEQAGQLKLAAEKLEELVEMVRRGDQAQLMPAYARRTAEVWLRAGQPDRALSVLGRLQRDDVETIRLRLQALDAAGRTKQAARMLEQGRGSGTVPSSEWIALLGDRTSSNQTEDAALEQILGQLTRNNERVDTATRASAYLIAWQRPSLAARLLDSVGLPEAPSVDLLRVRAQALYGAGRLGEAEAAYRLLLESRPDDPGAMNDLGYLLVTRGGSLEEAVALLEKAVRMNPNEPAFLDSLGWALHHAGQPERALPLLQKAVREARSEADVGVMREHLGDVYLALGDPQRAVAEWQAALRFGGEDPDRLQQKIRAHAELLAR